MATKTWLTPFMILVFLSASVYFMWEDNIKIHIGKTSTSYDVWENDKWVLAATEYVNLFDGTTKMRAKSRVLSNTTEGDISTIVRTSLWKDNITTIETYVFDKTVTMIEQVPIEHTVRVINAENKILHFEYRNILYDGDTQIISSPFKFGHKMILEWEGRAYLSKVYQQMYTSDKIIIRYRVNNSDDVFRVRLYDPIAFDTKAEDAESAVDPRTMTYTVGSGGTLLVLSLTTKTSDRGGGAPTYNNVELIQAGTRLNGGEMVAELWYMLAPPTGSPLTISVPNPNTNEVNIVASSYSSSTGYTKFDTNEASGVSTNPTVSLTPGGIDGVIVDSLGTGYKTPPSGNAHVLLYQRDTGNEGYGAQYVLNASGSTAMSWTQLSDDWVLVAASFLDDSFIQWNDSSYDFGSNNIVEGNVTTTLDLQAIGLEQTNVNISCSGDCSNIVTNWTISNITKDDNVSVLITCINSSVGIYNAVFNVTSDEDTIPDSLTVDCSIIAYGTLNLSWLYPTTDLGLNQSDIFWMNVTATCNGISGAECGTVSAYARYNGSSVSPNTNINTTLGGTPFYVIGGGSDSSTGYWRPINYTATVGGTSLIHRGFDKRYNDTTSSASCGNAGGAGTIEYIYNISSLNSEAIIYITADALSTNTIKIYNYTLDDFQTWFSATGTVITYILNISMDNGLISEEGIILIEAYGASYIDDNLLTYDTYISTQDTITYDFVTSSESNFTYSIGPGCTNAPWCTVAWGTEAQKDNFNYSDSIDYSHPGWYEWFHIKINESPSSINSLAVRVEYNTGNTITLWDGDGWDKTVTDTGNSMQPDHELYYEIINESIPNYIDSEGYLHIQVYGLFGGGAAVDYVNVNVISEGVSNPQSTTLSQGESYNFSWSINYTGTSDYYIDVLANSSFGTSFISSNNTIDRQVCFESCAVAGPDILVEYSSGISELRYYVTSPTIQDLEPTGQTSIKGVFNVTNNGSDTVDVCMWINESYTGVATECAPNYFSSGSITLTTSPQQIIADIIADDFNMIWCRRDYSSPATKKVTGIMFNTSSTGCT